MLRERPGIERDACGVKNLKHRGCKLTRTAACPHGAYRAVLGPGTLT